MFGFINHNITDLNKFAKCNICNGYLIDATTVIECMHSFCKTCIMKHLEDFNTCPTCKCQLHETKPYLDVRTDKVLQTIVYKLFPNIHRNEMHRRKDFYEISKDCHELPQLSPEKRGDIVQDSYSNLDEDLISIALTMRSSLSSKSDNEEIKPIYLLCPSCLTVGHLVKFLTQKLSVHSSSIITLFCLPLDELDHKYSLVDILCLYPHNNQMPLSLHYCLTSSQSESSASSSSSQIIVSSSNNDDCKRLFFVSQERPIRNKNNLLRGRIKPRLNHSSKSMTII